MSTLPYGNVQKLIHDAEWKFACGVRAAASGTEDAEVTVSVAEAALVPVFEILAAQNLLLGVMTGLLLDKGHIAVSDVLDRLQKAEKDRPEMGKYVDTVRAIFAPRN